MASIVGYHSQKLVNCGCGAIVSYVAGEVSYNSAGVGTIRCPACGGYPVVSENSYMATFQHTRKS